MFVESPFVESIVNSQYWLLFSQYIYMLCSIALERVQFKFNKLYLGFLTSNVWVHHNINHYSHCGFFFGHSLAPGSTLLLIPLPPIPAPLPPLTMSVHTPTSLFSSLYIAPLPLNVHVVYLYTVIPLLPSHSSWPCTRRWHIYTHVSYICAQLYTLSLHLMLVSTYTVYCTVMYPCLMGLTHIHSPYVYVCAVVYPNLLYLDHRSFFSS
jgi:hypothetical protein